MKPDTQRAVRALLAAARRERDKKLVVTTDGDRPTPRRPTSPPPSIQL